jgi:hypothetical protein
MTSPKSEELRRLLARMREESPDESHNDPTRPAPTAEPRTPRQDIHPAPRRFRLTVDDGGEFLVLAGESATLGHAHAARADLPLLADLEPIHARFSLQADFHSGPSWSVAPVGSARVRVQGVPVANESATLEDGDELELGGNVHCLFRLPERASGSALLEFLHGAESEGAVRVLLMAPGLAGRIRIGPRVTRHIPVAGLEHEVELMAEADELRVACVGGLRGMGPAGPLSVALEQRLPLPLSGRYDLQVNGRPSGRIPFGLGLSPISSSPGEGALASEGGRG